MSPGQLTMHGVDITDLYEQVYEYIVAEEEEFVVEEKKDGD